MPSPRPLSRAAAVSAWRPPVTPRGRRTAATGSCRTSLDLPDQFPPTLRQRILDDLERQDHSVADGLLGEARCRAVWEELTGVYEAGHMAGSRSSVRVAGRSLEFTKPNVLAISDFGLVDGDHGEAPERLLGPLAPGRWAASPIRRTRELEAFLGRLLRWVFDGLPVAGAETAPLSITTAHAKVAVSLGPSPRRRQPGFYVPHFDNTDLPQDRRRVAAVYYPNPHWLPAHGGLLRCYPLGAGGPVDIAPQMDRLVVFRADVLLHAVIPYNPPPPQEEEGGAAGDRGRRRWAFVEWGSEPAARALADAVQKQAEAKRQYAAVIQSAAAEHAALLRAALTVPPLARPFPPPY